MITSKEKTKDVTTGDTGVTEATRAIRRLSESTPRDLRDPRVKVFYGIVP